MLKEREQFLYILKWQAEIENELFHVGFQLLHQLRRAVLPVEFTPDPPIKASGVTLTGGSTWHRPDAVLGIVDHLRRRLARFELGTHLLDLRGLLFELRRENLHPFLLLRDR